ncbi:MAG: PIN domain-containing protein [Bacteroidales bacterium]|nr:PIN domain-containing protein [Bacteroidales bacterium]
MENQVNFLVDTNIWLERLLDQEKSAEVQEFLNKVPADLIFISDFTLHSIGIIMSKFEKDVDYFRFIKDLFSNGRITQLGLEPLETGEVILNIKKLNLDYDDSYQYSVSKKFDLRIVTFDMDFRKSGIETYKPLEAISLLENKINK